MAVVQGASSRAARSLDASRVGSCAGARGRDASRSRAVTLRGCQRRGPGDAVSVAALPQVEGRHRNRALAAARRARAIELRAQGRTYEQIADELGYANRGTVCRIVGRALEAQTVEAVDVLRSLEVERLDAVQVAIWDKAMSGDVHAAKQAIRIIAARCRLLGLEGRDWGKTHERSPQTVVLPPDY